MKYHLTPVRMVIIKKSTYNKCCSGYGKGNPLALLMLMESDIATMEDGRKKKLGLKPPCDSAIPPLGIYLEETKTEKKNPCTPMFIAALLIVRRTWKQPRCSLTKEWIKKLWCIYIINITQPYKGMYVSQL